MTPSNSVARCTWFTGAVLLALLVNCPGPVNAGPITYSILNLQTPGTSGATPTAINSSGVAVGYTLDSYGNQLPVSLNGQTTYLPGYGTANGINASGTVVGATYAKGAFSGTVAEWSNGTSVNLGSAIPGSATSINDAGQITGGMLTNGQVHAFTLSNGVLVDLGTLNGGTGSMGYGINASGQIAGTSYAANGTATAFLSNGATLQQVAGSLGGASSYGMAVNDSGVVVGAATTAQNYVNAFESSSQGMVDLGTLGGTQSYAYGINAAGTVVGYSFTTGNVEHGFVYSGGILLDLNNLLPLGSGWTIDAAYGINGIGDIVGEGTYNGKSYAVELLPSGNVISPANGPLATPEPAALLLTGIGLIAVGKLRRSKKSAPAII